MTLSRFRTVQVRATTVDNARFGHGRFGHCHSAAARPAVAPPPTLCSPLRTAPEKGTRAPLPIAEPERSPKLPLWSHQSSRQISYSPGLTIEARISYHML